MPSITAYHRPANLDEAAELLSNGPRRALGGGTAIVPEARKSRVDGVELVDLQDLGLDSIEASGNRIRVGAMVRLGDLLTDDRIPELIRDMAKAELPSALRNQATVGGTIVEAESTSQLLGALLVHEASVELHGGQDLSLATYLASDRDSAIVVAVSILDGGRTSIASTGRTPGDQPIVAALARNDGKQIRVCLTGVAATPLEVDPKDPTAGIEPEADFRGTADYRRHLGAVLAKRAIEEVA